MTNDELYRKYFSQRPQNKEMRPADRLIIGLTRKPDELKPQPVGPAPGPTTSPQTGTIKSDLARKRGRTRGLSL